MTRSHLSDALREQRVLGEEPAHLEVLPRASRSSHRVDSDRSEAARGASGGGLCSYCLSSALDSTLQRSAGLMSVRGQYPGQWGTMHKGQKKYLKIEPSTIHVSCHESYGWPL